MPGDEATNLLLLLVSSKSIVLLSKGSSCRDWRPCSLSISEASGGAEGRKGHVLSISEAPKTNNARNTTLFRLDGTAASDGHF